MSGKIKILLVFLKRKWLKNFTQHENNHFLLAQSFVFFTLVSSRRLNGRGKIAKCEKYQMTTNKVSTQSYVVEINNVHVAEVMNIKDSDPLMINLSVYSWLRWYCKTSFAWASERFISVATIYVS